MEKGAYVELKADNRVLKITKIERGRLFTGKDVVNGLTYTFFKSSIKKVIDLDKQWNETAHF